MNDSELKPCPFCGHIARIYHRNEINMFTEKERYMAMCIHCLTKSKEYPTYEQAKRGWNRRDE